METVTLQKETLYNFIDTDLFTLFYHDEIMDTVYTAAENDNVDVFNYLTCRYPDAEINCENEKAYMCRVFIDKLASSRMII